MDETGRPSKSFRPLGLRLRNFGRSMIRNYVGSVNMAPPPELPPAWEKETETPLIWRKPEETGLMTRFTWMNTMIAH